MSKLWPVMILVALACFFLAHLMRPASSHDWYSTTTDPAYQSSCCGGHDCAPVDPSWVSEVPEGYRLRMSIEEAKTVNPAADAPVDAVIPWSRVQSPPNADHLFYACVYDRDRAPPRNGVICFFATPTM